MDLMLNADQEAIVAAIREVLSEQCDSAHLRAAMDTDAGFDEQLWATAAELGWFGLALAEEHGGTGYGVPEAMLLFVELGRSLAAGPWLGAVLGARALAAAGHAGVADVVAGRRRVVVLDDPADTLGGPALRGEVRLVLDAHVAHLGLVLGSSAVRIVELQGRGVEATPGWGIDPTRRVSALRFQDAPAETLAAEAADVRRLGAVLVAAEASGIAERTQEASVDYAKVREQFGRPIGSFQAIKHRCADMAVRAEVARSATTFAAVALAEQGGDVDLHVHVAKALATDAAIQNATDNIQNHGGMGYTWESDAHLYLKRARTLEHVLGTRSTHLDAIAAPWRATG